MNVAGKIIAYLAGVLALGCLLAPPLYWLGQALGAGLGIGFLQEASFQRYFNRAMLIAAVALLWPVAKWLEIKKWSDLQLHGDPQAFRHLTVGFFAAFLLLFAMGLLAFHLEVYHPQSRIRWEKFYKIPQTVIAVSLLEETLFRGVMMGLLLRATKPLTSLLFVSSLFSIVHFLKPVEGVDLGEIGWLSGFPAFTLLISSIRRAVCCCWAVFRPSWPLA